MHFDPALISRLICRQLKSLIILMMRQNKASWDALVDGLLLATSQGMRSLQKNIFISTLITCSLVQAQGNKCVESLKASSQIETGRKTNTVFGFFKNLLIKDTNQTPAAVPVSAEKNFATEIFNREQEEIRRQERAEKIKHLKTQSLNWSDRNPFFAKALHERLWTSWLRTNVLSKKPIFLTFGSSRRTLTKIQEEALEQLILELARTRRPVFYEKDDAAAAMIRNLLPSAIEMKLENPFLKLETILNFSDIVMTPESLMGLGLTLEGQQEGVRANFHLFDPNQQWKNSLTAWSEKNFREPTPFFSAPSQTASKKSENLGIKYSSRKEPRIVISADELKKGWALSLLYDDSKPLDPRTIPSFRSLVLESPDLDFTEALSQATDQASSIQKLELENSQLLGGAVVFGSGKGSNEFDELVFKSVQRVARRGAAIRHGGAGGFMQTAGEAALAEKSLSLGVPLIGKNSLKSEAKISRGSQTFTIPTSAYSIRIPTLLEAVPLVILAPGGMGTMKELATTLVDEASASRHRWIVLISQGYYGPLQDFLQSLPIPTSMKEKIRMISHDSEMETVLDEIKKTDPEAYEQMIKR